MPAAQEKVNVALFVVLGITFVSLMVVGICLWRKYSNKSEDETELKPVNDIAQPGEKYKE